MKLIFVYNAYSGLLNAIKDALHKTVHPASYPCSLCALTYGCVSEKRIWRSYHKRSNIEMAFLHIDEFEKAYHQSFPYPVVLKHNKDLDIVLSCHQLDQIKTTEELIKTIDSLDFIGAR
jgi:hypothetical protein